MVVGPELRGGPWEEQFSTSHRERKGGRSNGVRTAWSGSCSIGLVALLTDACVQDERRDAAWTISIMLDGCFPDQWQCQLLEAIVEYSLSRWRIIAINSGMRTYMGL